MRDCASPGHEVSHAPARQVTEKVGKEAAVIPRAGTGSWKGRRLGNQSLTEEERSTLEERILALEIEHHDLDDVIARLSEHPSQDHLQLRRLKKRKLVLKDSIARLRDRLIPDIIA